MYRFLKVHRPSSYSVCSKSSLPCTPHKCSFVHAIICPWIHIYLLNKCTSGRFLCGFCRCQQSTCTGARHQSQVVRVNDFLSVHVKHFVCLTIHRNTTRTVLCVFLSSTRWVVTVNRCLYPGSVTLHSVFGQVTLGAELGKIWRALPNGRWLYNSEGDIQGGKRPLVRNEEEQSQDGGAVVHFIMKWLPWCQWIFRSI